MRMIVSPEVAVLTSGGRLVKLADIPEAGEGDKQTCIHNRLNPTVIHPSYQLGLEVRTSIQV